MKIYKFYRWGNFVKSVLTNNEIYFASVDEYKFCSYEFRDNFTNDFVETFGVFSCSKDYNNHTLWSDFACINTGVCLEFEFDEKFLDNEFIHDIVNYMSSDELKRKLTSENNLQDLFLIDNELSKEDEYRIIKTNLKERNIQFPIDSLKKIILGIDFKDGHLKELKDLLLNNASEYLNVVYKITNSPYQYGKSEYIVPNIPLKL